jgi:hypothetical protein
MTVRTFVERISRATLYDLLAVHSKQLKGNLHAEDTLTKTVSRHVDSSTQTEYRCSITNAGTC